MAIKLRRDKPLPEGLVYGITSIRLKSSLKPAEPPQSSGTEPAENPDLSTRLEPEKDSE